jgi:rfaE bifunctional protein nucleotidyltransferase chain/domain
MSQPHNLFDPALKIMSTADAARKWRARRRGPVVFTNGVFDLLHPGHVDTLRGARSLGNALIVGVNSDDSVKRLKGPTRPVRSEGDRLYVLAALACVDAVVLFGTDTPRDLIVALHPDVLVKGGDYAIDEIAGAQEVLAWGGSVKVIPLTANQSTTSIIRTIQALDATPASQ